MQPIEYNRLQAKVLAHLISDPQKLRTLHALTKGKGKECFTGPYLPFYLAIQWLNDNKKEINMQGVVGVVKKSKMGKRWGCVDVVEHGIKKQLGNDSIFGALVSKMLWYYPRYYPQKEINPLPPIKRCVLSERQVGFLELTRKRLRKDRWNEIKKHLNIKTPGVLDLSRAEASTLIDYVKKEGLLDAN